MSDISAFENYADYVQSANTLFHFMTKFEYLQSAITSKALLPRFCLEDVAYLNLSRDGAPVNEIAVLQKCFCDIPLNKLTTEFDVQFVNQPPGASAQAVDDEIKKCNTHPGLYGPYGIGFSKTWGEHNNLQPIQYLNQQSSFAKSLSATISDALKSDDLPDYIADDILRRLSFVKPLRGSMKRKLADPDRTEIVIQKNFHDEREWRYVPNSEKLAELEIGNVIANESIISTGFCNDISQGLSNPKYRELWLFFHYDDIQYIIVPNNDARIDVIKTIRELPDENFPASAEPERDRYVLASKILVLDSLRKDW